MLAFDEAQANCVSTALIVSRILHFRIRNGQLSISSHPGRLKYFIFTEMFNRTIMMLNISSQILDRKRQLLHSTNKVASQRPKPLFLS